MKFLKYHFPPLIYALIIITISFQTNLKTPSIRFLAFDKLAHFVEYAIFAFLIFRSFSQISYLKKPGKTFMFSALFIAAFAIFDEYFIQSLSRRTSDINDLLFDYCGSLLVLILLWVSQNLKMRNKAKGI